MYLIRERFFRLGEDSDITDEHGRPVLHVDGKVLSLRNRLVLRDPEGREVAQVNRKLVAMRPTYQVSIAGQEAAEVRKRLFTPFGDRFTIDVPGPRPPPPLVAILAMAAAAVLTGRPLVCRHRRVGRRHPPANPGRARRPPRPTRRRLPGPH